MIDGKRQLLRILGSGAFGTVYEARQLDLDRLEAIKFLHERWMDATTHGFRDRFLDEARVMARIRGKHVVEVYDWGTLPDGVPYVVMERLVGRSLRERLREGAVSLPDFFALAKQILEGLCEIHAYDVVHCDVKPENIFLGEHGLKLLDFGLAKSSAAADDALEIGTPFYMAPELLSGEGRPDARTDIYAASVVMYEMLTGRRPTDRRKLPHDERSSAAFDVRLPPSAYRLGVSAKLDALILEGLAERPRARPQTARALLDRLDELDHGSQRVGSPRRAGTVARARAGLPRFLAMAGAAAAVGLTCMAACPQARSSTESIALESASNRTQQTTDLTVSEVLAQATGSITGIAVERPDHPVLIDLRVAGTGACRVTLAIDSAAEARDPR